MQVSKVAAQLVTLQTISSKILSHQVVEKYQIKKKKSHRLG